jgi:peptidoglycan-N-acetylglucosamine deacetylase
VLRLPDGKRVAVSLSPDFDAQSAWIGGMGLTSPSYLSRGDFGADVGLPRVLEVFRRHEVKTTFFVPGHSMLTYPDRLEDILNAGHEIASHGCYHEPIPSLTPERERELIVKQLDQYRKMVGGRPRGYRSPAWDYSESTLGLLEEFGFEWDSSLMGRDLEPYRPRPVKIKYEEASEFGPPSKLLEFPVSWFLDDWPPMEFIPGIAPGLGDHELLFRRWKEIFDYARSLDHATVYTLTIHPQVIGRAHLISRFDQLVAYIKSFEDVWIAPLSSIFDTWVD